MTEYDTQPAPQRQGRRWPLAAVMLIDLVVIVVAVGLASLALAQVLIGPGELRASAGGANEGRLVRLLGAKGVFVLLLIQNTIFAGVPALRMALRREPLADIGLQAEHPLRLVLIGVGLGMTVLFANLVIGLSFIGLGVRQNQYQQFPLSPGDLGGQALFMIGAAALAPIGEETLFRGYLFNAIRRTFRARRWGVALAYLASALLFMIAHTLSATQGQVSLLTATFVMGLLLAWSMHRTGSLLPGVIAHALNNGVALISLFACINTPGLCPGV